MSTVEPLACLTKEHRPSALQLDGDRGNQQERRYRCERHQTNDYVSATLYPVVPSRNGAKARLERKTVPQLDDVKQFAAQAFVVAV